MAWVTPITWSSALVTVAQFNEQIRDNMNALKSPPTDYVDVNEGADYTTTSTSFADVDAAGNPDLSLTITTAGGDVMVSFHCTVTHSAVAGSIYLDFTVDGTRNGGDDGILRVQGHGVADRPMAMTFVRYVTGLAAGSHTFVLQWKTSGATATLYAGAGTSAFDLHPQFFVREIS